MQCCKSSELTFIAMSASRQKHGYRTRSEARHSEDAIILAAIDSGTIEIDFKQLTVDSDDRSDRLRQRHSYFTAYSNSK